MTTPQAYRPDVDGLRAFAVLAVLAFHAFPGAAPGGFAGVDVFFVISGFLISGILLEELEQRRFSLAEFYWRRVRRLFPALVMVLAASLALGWLLLLPDEFRALGKHVAAGAGFVSNIVLWRESGYFDVEAELKPLLHLWSLAVEEQYYLVWPIALALFARAPLRMPWLIAALAALSFAANLWLTAAKPAAAFFLPVGRFWELLAGALLACLLRRGRLAPRYGAAQAAAGAALLAASIALLDAERAFPGAWALLPVLGAALLIGAGPQAWLNARILSHPALVYVGRISYPLYLWHWPLLVYARLAHGAEPPPALRLALLALSLLLACLTYELVEKRVRGVAPSKRRSAMPALAASMAVAGLAGVAALSSRLPPQSAALPYVREISAAHADRSHVAERVIPGDTGESVLFLGDSHMQHYWPRIERLAEERAGPRHTVILRSEGGCAPVPGLERVGYRCHEFVQDALRLAHRPEIGTVVIAASWAGFLSRGDYYRVGDPEQRPLDLAGAQGEAVLHELQAALAALSAAGKRVVLLLSSPRGEDFDPKSLVRRARLRVEVHGALDPVPRGELAARTQWIDARLKRIAAAANAAVIDPRDWLCDAAYCPSADERGRPLYRDDSHLRASVARERFAAVDGYVLAR